MCENNLIKKEVMLLQLNGPFKNFYVQIEPTDRSLPDGRQYFDLILKDNAGIHEYFGSTPTANIDDELCIIRMLALHAIHDLIEDMFPEYYYPEDDE